MDWNLAEFRKPINLVFLGIAVVSLFVTLFTYLWSRHEARLFYHTATIQIVDQKEAVPFTVIDSDGHRVTENVYATNVTVWNSGDLSIEWQNVRSPLVISLSTAVRIIDAKLEYSTSDNISEFRIMGDPKKTGAVEMAWRYFDPKEGFRLRLIYANKDISEVKLNGVIFGINGFMNITPPPKDTISFKSPGFPQMGVSILFMAFGIIFQIIRVRSSRRERQEAVVQSDSKRDMVRLVAFACMLIAMGLQIWGVLATVFPPSPPF